MAFHAREAGVKASIESTVWRVLRDWGVAVLVACSVVPARAQPLPRQFRWQYTDPHPDVVGIRAVGNAGLPRASTAW